MRIRVASYYGLFLLLSALPILAERNNGELHLLVTDPTGSGVQAQAQLTSEVNQVRRAFSTDAEGRAEVKDLPRGPYQLRVERSGFARFSAFLEIRSEVPLSYRVTLGLASVETKVVVTESPTLLDPHRTDSAYYLGRATLREHETSQAGRAVLDLVQRQPGWLLEANGVLHPRGSEYETQYVIDGLPIEDNRSPAYAPPLEIEEIGTMNVFTADYPAEYGRKLGGVVEVVTARDLLAGWYGKAVLQAGSFSTQNGFLATHYGGKRTSLGLNAEGGHTDRYLDPPVEENFTNRAWNSGTALRFERDFNDADRLRLYVHTKRVGFLVPNERLQQLAGQRQDRSNVETMGQVYYQRLLSPELLVQLRAMGRDVSAQLWSNALSAPVLVDQDRGFREAYLGGSLSWHRGRHEFKTGGDAVFTAVHEQFGYAITDRRFFDEDVPLRFRFADRRQGREQSFFLQDLLRAGNWTISAGLRWDRYRLLVSEQALSPRLGLARYFPSVDLVLRASYDRAFQLPAIENVLLGSSEQAQRLMGATTGLPVPPSRGDFYQAGFSKAWFGKLRLDGNYFRRIIRNFADDDVLLNTGVSLPVAFSKADIHGFEARLELPHWGPLSGYLSYSNLVGRAQLPVTGGLFLREDAKELLTSTRRFPITQDQRNTFSMRWRYQFHPRLWAAFSASYGSGLPVEDAAAKEEELEQRVEQRVLERVDLKRGRVRPSYALAVSGGVDLIKREHHRVRLQADVLNLTDRLNVIDFAGLFSGTAIAPPRSFGLRLEMGF